MLITIRFWTDGDSGELSDGSRFRLARTKTPEKYDANYHLAKQTAEHLAPPGEELNIKIVGRDDYGRKLIEITKSGRNVNTELMNRFAMFQSQR